MKDGYYLSVYVSVHKAYNLYKIPARHNQCIALWRVTERLVELVHYWELERLTRN